MSGSGGSGVGSTSSSLSLDQRFFTDSWKDDARSTMLSTLFRTVSFAVDAKNSKTLDPFSFTIRPRCFVADSVALRRTAFRMGFAVASQYCRATAPTLSVRNAFAAPDDRELISRRQSGSGLQLAVKGNHLHKQQLKSKLRPGQLFRYLGTGTA